MKRSSSLRMQNDTTNDMRATWKSYPTGTTGVDAVLFGTHFHRNESRVDPAGGEQLEQSIQSKKTYFGFRPRPVNPQYAPDAFFEGECDVGPRAIWSPLHVECTSSSPPESTIVEAILWFNKGIGHHSEGDHESAIESYVYAITALSKPRSPSLVDLDAMNSCVWYTMTLIHNNLGQISYLDCDEENALTHFKTSLEFSKKVIHVDEETDWMQIVATVTSNLSRTLWMTEDFSSDSLDSNLREVLALRSLTLPPGHPDVACAHLNLGLLLFRRDEKKTAKEHLLEYLKYARLKSSELDPIPALTYVLIIKYGGTDDKVSSEIVQTAEELLKTRCFIGDMNIKVATQLTNLGSLLFNLGEFEDSLLFYNHELELESKLSGDVDGLRRIVTLNNIGRILQELERFNEAITCYEQALEMLPSVGTFDQIDDVQLVTPGETLKLDENDSLSILHLFSTIWYNLGLIHDKEGSRQEAIAAFLMSLNLRRRMYGPEHQDVACLWYNIGTLQMESNLIDEASLSLREAMRIKRMGFFREDPVKLVRTLSKLACLQEDKGRIAEAFTTREEILQLQTADNDACACGDTLLTMSELRFAQGAIDQALQLAEQSLDAVFQSDVHNYQELYYNENGAETAAKAMTMIAGLHHERTDFDLARHYLLKAQTLLEGTIRCNLGKSMPKLDSLLAGLLLLSNESCAPCA